ncbi:hypothetical protein HJFPF1_03667 [Paramyrothecium foliicola]|nr:hypothetical protein HJFPF1_03667 [Paramyrothecium foliicola]
MHRPRNRQPRPGRQNQPGYSGPPSRAPATPQQAAGTVPTQQQVIPGASVFIVLKEDQPTGRETQGIIQDVLGRGNHPRGIKVRLQGGHVGRVQRMGYNTSSSAAPQSFSASSGSSRLSHRYTDVRNDEYPSEPPSRSLADFMPTMINERASAPEIEVSSQQTVRCPFCEAFEGDEEAVTYHIEKTHLI